MLCRGLGVYGEEIPTSRFKYDYKVLNIKMVYILNLLKLYEQDISTNIGNFFLPKFVEILQNMLATLKRNISHIYH